MEAMPGMYMVASRRAVEATFKNSEVFSSEGVPRAGQRAAADPAERRPAPAPQVPEGPRPDLRPEADGRDRGRRHRAGQPLHRRSSIDRGECHFTHEFAEPFPSAVFLGPHGPAVGGARHLPAPQGRHHPPGHHRDGAAGAQQIQKRHRPGALRVLRRHPRRAARRHRSDDILTRFNPRRSRASSSRARRSSTSASCSSSPASTP